MVASAPSRRSSRSTPRSTRGPNRVIRQPNLGVYLDRRSADIDPRGMSDCLNVRIKNGGIRQEGLGWENFPEFATDANRINLDALQVLFIDEYKSRSGSTTAIFCNNQDVFRYNTGPETVTYLTPRYVTGTASSDGVDTEVDGAGGTLWSTAKTTLPIAGGYGNNVKTGDYIAFGVAGEVDLTATWWRIASVTNNTTLVLDLNPGVNGSGPYTIRQTLTGDNNDIFDSEIFVGAQVSDGASWTNNTDVYYLTNGLEMLEWDGAATEMEWFYPGFVAKGIIAHKQTLAFWNVLEGGTQKTGSIRFSEILKPRNFVDNGAGELQPADRIGDLLTILPIGDQIALYFQGDVVLMQYVGAPLFFVARVAVPGKGLVAQRAIMDFGDFHEFLSNDSSYRFDGVTLVPSLHQVFREVMRTINPNRIRQAYAHIDEENGEVVWSVVLNTDGQDIDQPPTTAFVQHYLEDVGVNLPTPMTIREFAFTAVGFYRSISSGGLQFSDFPLTVDGSFAQNAGQWNDRQFGEAFPFTVAGDANGDIYIMNRKNARNGVGFTSFARFPRVALGDGNIKGLVQRIEPHTTRRQGSSDYKLDVTLRIFDFVDGDSIRSTTEEFDMTHQGNRFVSPREGGRYGDVTFGSDAEGLLGGQSVPAQPWDINGYGLTVTPMGDR